MSSVVISGDTSGAITLAAPAVAGTNTATLPAATGTVMVSGNMPAFSAYQSSNQSFSSSTYTKVTFDTKEFDTNSNFASSRFTATVAGYYQFNFTVGSNVTNTRMICVYYKNGSNYKLGTDLTAGGSSGPTCNGSCLIYLNATDYVEVYIYMTAVSPAINGAANTTWFTGSLVRTA